MVWYPRGNNRPGNVSTAIRKGRAGRVQAFRKVGIRDCGTRLRCQTHEQPTEYGVTGLQTLFQKFHLGLVRQTTSQSVYLPAE
jgi:hypothetical protein